MQDLVDTPIVPPNRNGRDILIALCNLFDAPFGEIPEQLQPMALQIFGGLYFVPAIDDAGQRRQALDELDDMCNEYFPLTDITGLMPHVWDGIAMNWGTVSGTIRGAYFRTRAEMIVYRNKWRGLTMGDPEDLVRGYRWRRLVTGLFEAITSVVTAGGLYGIADAVGGKAAEGYFARDSLTRGQRVGSVIREGGLRARAGGSGVLQAATNGRGITALGSRGGALGLLGVYVIGHQYSILKDQEDDIRDAITLRVLLGEFDQQYLDDINGPLDVARDIIVESWYE